MVDPVTLSERVGERVIEGDTELVERSVRVTDTDSVPLEDCVAVTEAEGLGVEEMGGDGDVVLIIPEKW